MLSLDNQRPNGIFYLEKTSLLARLDRYDDIGVNRNLYDIICMYYSIGTLLAIIRFPVIRP